MAALTVHQIVNAGTVPTYVAPTTSDTAAIGSGSDSFLHYRNTDANAKTITVVHQGSTPYGVALPDNVLTLAASTGELMIPLVKAYDDGTGNATITLSGTGGVTGVTVALLKR